MVSPDLNKPFSSDFYDPIRQSKAWWDGPHSEDAKRQRDALRSRLRFDFLFSSSISLFRADVLDGACFQHTGPKEIREWLAVPANDPSPITVLTESGNLEGDLLKWVKPPRAKKLRAEPLLVIPPELHDAYYTEFPKLPSKTIRNYKDLAGAIARAVCSDDLKDRLSDYWASWIEEAQFLKVKRFTKEPDYRKHLPETLDASIFDCDDATAKEARELYTVATHAFCKEKWSRGHLLRWLEDMSHEECAEVAAHIVRDSMNIGIVRARAEANNTNHETILGARLSQDSLREAALKLVTDDSVTHQRFPLIDVALPDDLARWLAVCDYRGLLRSISNAREDWLQNKDPKSLKRLAEAIANFQQKNAPTSLPTLSAGADRIVRLAGFCLGAGWWVMRCIFKGGPGGLDGVVLLTSGVAGASVAKKVASKAVESLARQHVVHQVVQTVRNRGIE